MDLSGNAEFYNLCASVEVVETSTLVMEVKGYWKQAAVFDRESLISQSSTFALNNVIFRGFEANPAADKDTLRTDDFRPALDDDGFIWEKADGTTESVSATDAEAKGWNAYDVITEGASSGHYCQITEQ